MNKEIEEKINAEYPYDEYDGSRYVSEFNSKQSDLQKAMRKGYSLAQEQQQTEIEGLNAEIERLNNLIDGMKAISN